MKRRALPLLRATIILVLLALAITPASPPVKAAGAQKWQLKTDNYSGTAASDGATHACDQLMSGPSGWPSGPASSVEIASGNRAWWYSDVAAETGISFGSSTWQGEAHVFIDSGAETKTVTIRVWKVSSDGTAIELASGSWEGEVDTSHTHHQMTLTPGGSQDIPVGWRIAYSVEWSGGTANLKIGYNNTMGLDDDSWCETPSSDPGYPTPELSTLLLLLAGLALLTGLFVVRNRAARAARPT